MDKGNSQKRKYISFETTLFPLGITPGHIIQFRGDGECGKTFLMTYLIAKFLTTYPEKKAIFIDTQNHFNLPTLVENLWALNSTATLPRVPQNEWHRSRELVSFLERITMIKCCTPEELQLCFGPKSSGQLQELLESDTDYAIVFIDGLDTFSHCSSMNTPNPGDFLDFGKLLKRSLESTDTPVICTMLNLFRVLKKSQQQQEDADDEDGRGEDEEEDCFKSPKMYGNVVVDPTIFTHFVLLDPIPLVRSDDDHKITFICKAYLRSSNRPKIPLSGVNHFVRFSISSGILIWFDG